MRSLVKIGIGIAMAWIMLAGLEAASFAGDLPGSAVNAYNPFDESRPKIPQEIMADKRLDMKVKVFVKSENMKQLFADLSAKTGVKITASRELWGERPIIYFHSRSLRDVMTEISGLYGYHWLISGKPGAYEYEIFEDVRHFKLRGQRKAEQKDRQGALLMEFVDKVADGKINADASKRLQDGNEDAKWTLSDPYSSAFAKQIQSLGKDLLRKALADGEAVSAFNDLPPDVQRSFYESEKAKRDDVNAKSKQMDGEDNPAFPSPQSMADMADAQVYIRRRGGGEYGPPSFEMGAIVMDCDSNMTWPGPEFSDKDLRELVGWDVPRAVAGDAGVPSEPQITKKELSWINCSEGLRIGDVLQAIAEQSNCDIISDYYFGDAVSGFMDAIVKQPLNRVTRLVCGKYGSSCQADKQTIRFRCNDWFLMDTRNEPPAELLARCWADIENEGCLSFQDVVDLSGLSKAQRMWRGHVFIPEVLSATGFCRDSIRLWIMLDEGEIQTASSERGLPVEDLSPRQWQSLVEWAKSLSQPIDPESLPGARIYAIGTIGTIGGDGGRRIPRTRMQIKAGDKELFRGTIFPPVPLPDEMRQKLIAQRKADAEADVIEVVKWAGGPSLDVCGLTITHLYTFWVAPCVKRTKTT